MADTEPPTPPAQPTNFLSLPRELRDMVYTLTLVPPPLWNRTHLPTCPLLDIDTPWQWPVYRSTHSTVQDTKSGGFSTPDSFRRLPKSFIDKNRLTTKQVKACHAAGCHGRPGTGLRAANRQIHDETEEVFWEENTFCYDDQDMLLRDLTTVGGGKACRKMPRGRLLGERIAPCIPESAKAKIQRLSVMQLRNTRCDPWEVVMALQELPNLVKLELPASLVAKHLGLFSTLRLPGLRSITARHSECVVVDDEDRGPRARDCRLDVFLSKTVSLPPCSSSGHGGNEDHRDCESCREDLGRTAEEVLDPWFRSVYSWRLFRLESRSTVDWCVTAVREILEERVPVREEDGGPYRMELCLPEGGVEVAWTFGLPASGEAVRRRKEEMERMRAEKDRIGRKELGPRFDLGSDEMAKERQTALRRTRREIHIGAGLHRPKLLPAPVGEEAVRAMDRWKAFLERARNGDSGSEDECE
ncbi:hypothetical protein LTR12_007494 [Friedmanniomyces endolithicus]|nr:hypothetical protein LTR74_006650 [Friedmanniomyces endolithicus]KAK1818087.1 hypothetical protein LTR12_007494 [Friedmanniomyces endolithicus]